MAAYFRDVPGCSFSVGEREEVNSVSQRFKAAGPDLLKWAKSEMSRLRLPYQVELNGTDPAAFREEAAQYILAFVAPNFDKSFVLPPNLQDVAAQKAWRRRYPQVRGLNREAFQEVLDRLKDFENRHRYVVTNCDLSLAVTGMHVPGNDGKCYLLPRDCKQTPYTVVDVLDEKRSPPFFPSRTMNALYKWKDLTNKALEERVRKALVREKEETLKALRKPALQEVDRLFFSGMSKRDVQDYLIGRVAHEFRWARSDVELPTAKTNPPPHREQWRRNSAERLNHFNATPGVEILHKAFSPRP